MHILYVDESGSVGNPNETFFVLGGVSVFERGIYHQIKEVDDLVAGLSLGDAHEIELHGTVIYQGREPPWRALPRPDREKIIKRALGTLGLESLQSGCSLSLYKRRRFLRETP